MVANLISAVRVLLVIVAGALLLHASSPGAKALAAVFIFISLVLDAVDGVVARRLGQASRAGEVLDIGGDRLVEVILWVIFAQLGFVSVWVPVIVLGRGVATDTLRSVALAGGRTAFGGEQSMMRTPLGRVLVTSRFSRGLYGVVKMIAFCWIAGLAALTASTDGGAAAAAAGGASGTNPLLWIVKDVLVWTTVALCLVRGLPVLAEGTRLLLRPDAANQTTQAEKRAKTLPLLFPRRGRAAKPGSARTRRRKETGQLGS